MTCSSSGAGNAAACGPLCWRRTPTPAATSCSSRRSRSRLTPDNRILFGGYDAVYHFGSRISPDLDQRRATFELLARHFFATFPPLEGLRFTHAWGGAVDLCSRFCTFFGTAYSGRVAYAAGYTGLGVGATRFGAQVMLDLLERIETERTATAYVRSKPVRFPPEPLATTRPRG
ncbi:MAG: FAD-dependent oxidoreductase [Nocardioidaceae bacterium]